MKQGKFIVFEGGDGAGKDTQIELLKSKVNMDEYVFVRDPGSTEIGEKLRSIVLFDKRIAKPTEMLMYLAIRAQMVSEKVLPALTEGKTVISNRFDLSTIAYQVYGRERENNLDFVREISAFANESVTPDLIIYLDCPPAIGIKRTMETKSIDRFEEEKVAFHERVIAGYKKHLPDYPHVIVDGTRSVEEVHADVMRALEL